MQNEKQTNPNKNVWVVKYDSETSHRNGSSAISRFKLYESIPRSNIHSLGKQFIVCLSPRRIDPEPEEFAIQVVVHNGSRCNQPCYARVIPMIFHSLPALSQVNGLCMLYQTLKYLERNTMTWTCRYTHIFTHTLFNTPGMLVIFQQKENIYHFS